ncbi:MAG: flagellar biosynthesis anti-sigma factor FlgM [Bdellovibrionales bacterium]|nr:flagellar biosynthesis anti-sigma factor FlgM [Bdellovibrionales bacterium]
MKVNNSIGPKLTNVDAAKSNPLESVKTNKQANSTTAAELAGSSKVNLSERAQLMQKARDIATNTEDVNEAKVARLQKLIDEGKYQVNAQAIADKMVDEHMLFPSE